MVVRLHPKFLRLGLVVFCAMLLAGCSGVNTGGSVSPATFFMPGIMKADPAPVDRQLQVKPEPVIVIAQVR